jgi:hypothetical protein
MALLMVSQFIAAPDAWLNRGAGGSEDGQLTAALGHIRPAGTFTFVTGPPLFFSLVTAFAVNALFVAESDRLCYPRFLTGSAALALVGAVAVSGSRTMLASVAVVLFVAVLMASFVRPNLFRRLLKGAITAAAVIAVVSQFGAFQDGLATLSARISVAADVEGGSSGVVDRAFSDFTKPFELWSEVPNFGHGLGMGTNVGAKLLTGDSSQFLLAETEWARVLMESGPVPGTLYLLLRLAACISIGSSTLRYGRTHGDALPLLLFAACALPFICGSWGQPTVLGFANFTAGVVLAAVRRVPSGMGTNAAQRVGTPQRRVTEKLASVMESGGGTA